MTCATPKFHTGTINRVCRQFCRRLSTRYRGLLRRRITIESTLRVRVADACFTLAGSGALYETSLLQRRMRDLHVAAQHAAAQPRNYVNAGKLLLGDTTAKSQVVAMKAEPRPMVSRTI